MSETRCLPVERRLPVLLRRAWYGLNQRFRDRIEPLGITPSHFSILRWLSEGDPRGLSQRTLTELMGSDPNTMSATLTRMERMGFIKRTSHERDRRACRVGLCAAGRAKYAEALPLALTHQENALASVPASRRERFLKDLEIVAKTCGGSLEVRAPSSPADRSRERMPRRLRPMLAEIGALHFAPVSTD